MFVFQKDLTLVLCVSKKTNSVVLLCTIPPLMKVMKRIKPEIIQFYNATKEGIDGCR